MSLFTKLALGGAALIVAVVLFVVLRPDGDDEQEASPAPATETVPTATEAATTEEATTQEEATTEETTTEATTTEPPGPPPPQRISVRFRDGEVVGGVQVVDVDRNRQVVLVVRSDVADHVHVHGYDLLSDVVPGTPTRIRFRATDVGRFEVELEDRTLPLVDLRVNP
jgi:hypothetical protein